MAQAIDDKSNSIPVKIAGETEEHCADVIEDIDGGKRLLVEANVPGGPGGLVTLPSTQFLKNGSSKDMNVDGSVTPVEFSFSPGSGTFFVKSVTLFILDPGKMEPTNFGSEPALTNGLQLSIKTDGGTETEIVNLQDNLDLAVGFQEQLIAGNTANSTWMHDDDWFKGTLVFHLATRIDSSQADEIKFIVRDDLTGIKALRASIFAWEVQ